MYFHDGTGSGRRAAVDLRNRMRASTISQTESEYATALGLSFNVNTGDITINNAVKLTVLYLKNNDSRDIVIDSFFYNQGTTTGGSGDVIYDIVRNPTTGGIITSALPVAVGTTDGANFNFGDSQTLNCTIYKGAVGQAVVNGFTQVTRRSGYTSQPQGISPGGGIIIPRGDSIAINYTPPTGNTNMITQFGLNVYVKDDSQ